MSSGQIDHAKVVSDLFQDIITHASYEKLKGISDQNAELHDKVEKLTTTLEMNLENLHKTKAKLDKFCHELRKKDEQVQSLQKEADDLGSILAAKTHELDERAQIIARADDELRKAKLEIMNLTERLEEERKQNEEREAIEQELKLTREYLDQNKDELGRLKNFSTPLKSMDAGNITKRFTKIFDLARELAMQFFGVDLPESSIANAALWDQLKKHNIVHQARIPLPLSNTLAARQMRSVAVLAVLFAELKKHVFHPTHLFEDPRANDEFTALLKTMDPAKEAYLRSVLFGCIDDDQWKQKVKAKVVALKASVDNCVGPLLSESERVRFMRHLDRFCRRTCQIWQSLQKLETKIHYSTEDWAPPDTDEYRVLPLSSMVVMNFELPDVTYPGEYPESPKQKQRLMGNGQSSPLTSCSNVTFTHDIDRLSASPSPSRSTTRTFDISSTAAVATTSAAGSDLLSVVWPAFHVEPRIPGELIWMASTGYGVCDSQLKAAREEEAHLSGTHRTSRRNRRCRGMSSARSRTPGVSGYRADDGGDHQDGGFENGCESTLSSFLNAGRSELSTGSKRCW